MVISATVETKGYNITPPLFKPSTRAGVFKTMEGVMRCLFPELQGTLLNTEVDVHRRVNKKTLSLVINYCDSLILVGSEPLPYTSDRPSK